MLHFYQQFLLIFEFNSFLKKAILNKKDFILVIKKYY